MATTYDSIANFTFNNTANTYTFSSIASSWTDLRIVISGTTATGDTPRIRFNSDSGTNYSATFLAGNGSTTIPNYEVNRQFIYLGFGSMSATVPTLWTADIFSYGSSNYKTCLTSENGDLNGSGYVSRIVNTWRSTSAINSITLFTQSGNNFSTGTVSLYGIKAA